MFSFLEFPFSPVEGGEGMGGKAGFSQALLTVARMTRTLHQVDTVKDKGIFSCVSFLVVQNHVDCLWSYINRFRKILEFYQNDFCMSIVEVEN